MIILINLCRESGYYIEFELIRKYVAIPPLKEGGGFPPFPRGGTPDLGTKKKEK